MGLALLIYPYIYHDRCIRVFMGTLYIRKILWVSKYGSHIGDSLRCVTLKRGKSVRLRVHPGCEFKGSSQVLQGLMYPS